MLEEHRNWLDNESNYNYLRKYIKHQKTAIVKLINGPKNREQFVKSRIALELLDKKIILISKVLVLPEDVSITTELQKWLEDQEKLIKKNFSECGKDDLNDEETGMLEKTIHIDIVMQTIITAQKKSNEKKRLSDSTSDLQNRDSIGSIGSEILMECIEEVDNEMMKFGDNDIDTIDEKPDSADKTLLGDLGSIPLHNESNSMSEKSIKVEYATNADLIQLEKSMEEKILKNRIEVRTECISDWMCKSEKTVSKIANLQLGMEKMARKIKDLEKKLQNMVSGNGVGGRECLPEVNRYRESCLRERMKMLAIFSGEREEFNTWKSNVEETLREFDDVKSPEFILYQWLESKTSNDANILIKPFKAFPKKPFGRA